MVIIDTSDLDLILLDKPSVNLIESGTELELFAIEICFIIVVLFHFLSFGNSVLLVKFCVFVTFVKFDIFVLLVVKSIGPTTIFCFK